MESNSVLEHIYNPNNHNLLNLYYNDMNSYHSSKTCLKDYIRKYNGSYIYDVIIDNLLTLLENGTLSELYLRTIAVNNRYKLLEFITALLHNKSLEVLDFSYNSKIIDVIHELLLVLKTDIHLRFLYLTKTSLDFGNIKLLSEALMVNTNLVHLNISNNNIGDKGLECILESLKEKNTLMWLDISNNEITKNGVEKLTDAFKYNTSLTTLDISTNSIGIEGLDILVNVFEYNNTLVNLNLESCWIVLPYNYNYNYEDSNNSVEFTNSQSYKLIEEYTLRNRVLYDNTYWKPYLNSSFPPELRHQFLTFMICNKTNTVVLPFNICIQIFTFFQRKSYY